MMNESPTLWLCRLWFFPAFTFLLRCQCFQHEHGRNTKTMSMHMQRWHSLLKSQMKSGRNKKCNVKSLFCECTTSWLIMAVTYMRDLLLVCLLVHLGFGQPAHQQKTVGLCSECDIQHNQRGTISIFLEVAHSD